MNAHEIAAYKNETARRLTEEATRTHHDQQFIDYRDKATRTALQVLADADHVEADAENEFRRLVGMANASSTPVYVADTIRILLDPRNDAATVLGMDLYDAYAEDTERTARLIAKAPCAVCGELRDDVRHRDMGAGKYGHMYVQP